MKKAKRWVQIDLLAAGYGGELPPPPEPPHKAPTGASPPTGAPQHGQQGENTKLDPNLPYPWP